MDAEADYLRMCRLRRMDRSDLRALLAGDPAEAARWIETAARFGVAEAQVRLARMLLDGAGVPRDTGAALTWFSRAARQGAPDAMNMVGRCHENAWGTPQDLAQAACCYRKSADAGCDWGEYNYANMLFDGRGVARDLAQAVYWYRRASDQGHARAMNLLGRCYEEGWGVARDGETSGEWYRRSAALGYFRAQFNHGTKLVERGRLQEALDWLEAGCRAAPPDSLGAMVERLVRTTDPRLSELGRRMARTLAPPERAVRGVAS